MNKHKLSHLPIYAIRTGIQVLSYTAEIGYISALDIIDRELWISIDWDNDTKSFAPAKDLKKVYVIADWLDSYYKHLKDYGTEDLSEAQINWFNKFSPDSSLMVKRPDVPGNSSETL